MKNEKKTQKNIKQNMIDLEKEMQEISLELNTQQMSQSAIKRRKVRDLIIGTNS